MAFLCATHGERILARIRLCVERVSLHPNEARIHALRVSMKRLAMLLSLVRHSFPELHPPKGPMHRLKRVYKAAGRQRELQVSRSLVAKLPRAHASPHEAFKVYALRRESKLRRALANSLMDLRKDDLERIGSYVLRAASGRTRSQELVAARRYLEQELRSARSCMDDDQPEALLHTLRTHVKNAWLALRLLQEAGAMDKDLRYLSTKLAKLQQVLGERQDVCVLLLELEAWCKGGPIREWLLQVFERRRLAIERQLFRQVSPELGTEKA